MTPDTPPAGTPAETGPPLRRDPVERALSFVLGGVVAVLIFFMMMLTFVDVVGRYFFNSPVQGGYELTELALGMAVFAALPLTTILREHVTVSLFEGLFRGIGFRIQQFFVGVVSMAALGAFTWRLWEQSERLASFGDRTVFLKLPYAPVAYFMTAMCALSTLIVLVLVWRQVTSGRRG